jgi:hypothetical protein
VYVPSVIVLYVLYLYLYALSSLHNNGSIDTMPTRSLPSFPSGPQWPDRFDLEPFDHAWLKFAQKNCSKKLAIDLFCHMWYEFIQYHNAELFSCSQPIDDEKWCERGRKHCGLMRE